MFEDRPRILLVEDHPLIAMEMEGLVAQCGCAVAACVGSVGEGLQAARSAALDGAVLDVELADGQVWPLVELLARRHVPFLLATGIGRNDMPERFRRCPMLPKPVGMAALRRTLRQIGALPGEAPPEQPGWLPRGGLA